MIKCLAVLALAVPLAAQTAKPTAPVSTPAQPTPSVQEEKLTTLEQAGLNQIAQAYQQLLERLSQANIDVAKNHPGYHLDPQNPLSGKLVKDPEKKPGQVLPEKK